LQRLPQLFQLDFVLLLQAFGGQRDSPDICYLQLFLHFWWVHMPECGPGQPACCLQNDAHMGDRCGVQGLPMRNMVPIAVRLLARGKFVQRVVDPGSYRLCRLAIVWLLQKST
jgi:hypothetical protein